MIDVAGRLDSRYLLHNPHMRPKILRMRRIKTNPGGVAGCDRFLSGWALRGGDGGRGVRVPVVVKLINDELALS